MKKKTIRKRMFKKFLKNFIFIAIFLALMIYSLSNPFKIIPCSVAFQDRAEISCSIPSTELTLCWFGNIILTFTFTSIALVFLFALLLTLIEVRRKGRCYQ